MKNKIERIKFLLSEAHKNLCNITEDNFDETLLRVKKMLAESQKNKSYLLAKFSMPELKIFEPELTKLSKQISETFDNIIEKKRQDIAVVADRIKFVQNQKKLVNYHR